MELKEYKLGDLIEVTRGMSLPGEFYSTEGKYIRLTCGNFDYVNNSFKENKSKDDLYYVGKIKPEFIMEKGDIITPLTEQAIGLLGSTAIIPESGKYIQSQDVAKVTCKKGMIDHDFAYYLIPSKCVKEQLSAAAQQTKIRHTSPDAIKACKVFVPPLSEQKKIASVLSALDDKIALNKKMNQKLEAMAKRLYDYWFVQYDFPDKNGHPYKTTGVPMTYNPTLKREIPAGWEVKTLKECIKHINTGLNPRDNFVLGNGDIKYVTVKNLTTEGNIDFSGCDLIDEDALKKVHKRSDIAKGDVLYASICPLGRSYLINKDPIGWDINESVFSIRPNLDVISSEFLSMFLKDSAVVEKASKMATGSIFKGIRIKELENMIFAVPAKNVMESFSKQIKNLIELEHKNIEEITRLTALRDKLLPLLMNGQVVVG